MLLHNALAFQVTEWFEVTVRFFFLCHFAKLNCHLDQLCDNCCCRDDKRVGSNAADFAKVKNPRRQRPT